MARPERNTVDYYPFFVGEGKKMFFIEKKYGNDGYATWLKIIDKLCITNFHYLNLNDEGELMFLASKCNIEEDRLINIITDIAKLGKFDKDLWQFRIIWCQSFVDSIQDAYKKRNNKCMTIEGLRILLTSLGVLNAPISSTKGSVKPQTKVDYTKVEEKRLKKTKVTSSTETTVSDGIYPECFRLYDEFLKEKTGVGANFSPASGAAMNKIIAYLKTQITNKDDFQKEIPRAFEYIFKNYKKWDLYCQKQLKLNQIESNLINILNSIRNGTPQQKSRDERIRDAEKDFIIAKYGSQ